MTKNQKLRQIPRRKVQVVGSRQVVESTIDATKGSKNRTWEQFRAMAGQVPGWTIGDQKRCGSEK